MCLEIIKHFPNSSEPYEHLATIYDEKGQDNKALHFKLIAAFTSNNAEKWLELAAHYKGVEDLEEAVYCYSRAIKLSPTDIRPHLERIALLQALEQIPKVLRCSTYMLKFLKTNDPQVH